MTIQKLKYIPKARSCHYFIYFTARLDILLRRMTSFHFEMENTIIIFGPELFIFYFIFFAPYGDVTASPWVSEMLGKLLFPHCMVARTGLQTLLSRLILGS